ALTNDLSKIPPRQKKTAYLCHFLLRIAKGKNLECHFENDQRISPLESALSFWILLEKEEIKLEKLHEDIHRLIQIQVVAVYMENGYFREASEVLERLVTDSDSDKPLRVKLATIIKNKDPYVPLLQSFSYDLLISKIKSYVGCYVKENESNFLMQAATKQIEFKGLESTALQNKTANASEDDKENLETKPRFVLSIFLLRDMGQETETCTAWSHKWCLQGSVLGAYLIKQHEGHACTLSKSSDDTKLERWTYKEDLELKSGVREFGVGNWAKILIHGNFKNRTSVMLKDRWRTL
ncbi:TERF1 factor, partial [Upupa epops]|nr:TERF1 factor [Upupa epops]